MRLQRLCDTIDEILSEHGLEWFDAVELAIVSDNLVLVKGTDVIGSVKL